MSTTATLGEAGVPHDDETYGGTETSPVSLDYFRSQYLKFQQVLIDADAAYTVGVNLMAMAPDAELAALLDDYQARATWVKGIAATLNSGAELVNAMGGRMPSLSIPGSLGAGPLVVPVAVLVALGAVSIVVDYFGGFQAGVSQAGARCAAVIQAREDLDDEQKREILAQIAGELNKLKSTRAPGIFGSLEGVGKWLLLAGAAFVAWRAYTASR